MAVTQNGKKVKVTSGPGDEYRTAKAQAGINPLDGLTVAQALSWVDSNVTDLPSAKVAMKHIIKALFVLRAEVKRLKKE